MSFTIDLENGSHIAAMPGELAARTQNLQAPLASIGETLASNIQLGIKAGESPWGTPYAPLKKPRRSNRNPSISDKPLNDTRQHIYQRITQIASGDGVRVGIMEDADIGLTHQFGSSKKNIPARPFLPIRTDQVDLPGAWEAEIITILRRHFQAP